MVSDTTRGFQLHEAHFHMICMEDRGNPFHFLSSMDDPALQPRHKRMNLNALAIAINLLLLGAQVLWERFLLGSKRNAMHIHSISFKHIVLLYT